MLLLSHPFDVFSTSLFSIHSLVRIILITTVNCLIILRFDASRGYRTRRYANKKQELEQVVDHGCHKGLETLFSFSMGNQTLMRY